MDNFKSELTPAHIAVYEKIKGKRGTRFISLMGQQLPFQQAISTDLGQELLKDLMVIMEENLDLIISGEGKKSGYTINCLHCGSQIPSGLLKIHAKYEIVSNLVKTWSDRIATYNKNLKHIKDVAEGKNGR